MHRLQHILKGITATHGFFPVEINALGPFVWTKRQFGFRRDLHCDLFTLTFCYYGHDGNLHFRSANGARAIVKLYPGWHTYPLDLSQFGRDEIEVGVEPLIPVLEDNRELGIMIQEVQCLPDRNTYDNRLRAFENEITNEREFSEGRIDLHSLPVKLRIDLTDRCVMQPRCVYCEWDWVKSKEQGSAQLTSPAALKALGEFYACAREVVDCSCGDPQLNRQFTSIVSVFDRDDKHFEMTTSGLLMSINHRKALLGKKMILYVSMDSAHPEGYARYRNGEFRLVADGLAALCAEKRAQRDLPRVFLSCIAMRSNLKEFDEFCSAARRIGVDGVKLRTLYPQVVLRYRRQIRNGFSFDYDKECLTYAEFKAFSEHARGVAANYALDFFSETDAAFQPGSTAGPLCKEPWNTFYMFKRGIFPCCYSDIPLARLPRQVDENLGPFLLAVWNSTSYQSLRKALAGRELPEYCRLSKKCPIVRDALEAG